MFGGPADPYPGGTYGAVTDPYQAETYRAKRRRGGSGLRTLSLFVLLLCVGGAALTLVPQAFGLAVTTQLRTRGVMPRPKIAPPAAPEVCPQGMALVGDRFCMDRYEASTILVDENGEDKGPHSPYEMVENKRVRAESRPGVHPQAYISRNQASAACQLSGKRLCTDQEWLSACRGPERWDYPYGPTHEPKRCNDSERPDLWKHGALSPSTFKSFTSLNDPLMNQLYGLAKSGTFSRCATPDGIHDLVGNLHEWTADPGGTFRGGYYRNTRTQNPSCSYATDAHNALYHDYSTGFRCCADPRR
jgi:formylglycine-generating enzyme